jgi:hypothetical protein
MADDEEIPDFTEEREDVAGPKFKIDDEIFECAPWLGAGAVQDLITLQRAMTSKDRTAQITTYASLLDSILLPESMTRFTTRMRSPIKPITQSQLENVVLSLVARYSKRPTEPASPSSIGATAGGQS